jgi:hypothetical protein
MKKLLVICLMTAMALQVVVVPRKAHATLGVMGYETVLGAHFLATAGALIAAGGVYDMVKIGEEGNKKASFKRFMRGLGVFCLGVVLLDEQGKTMPVYVPLSAERAAEIGLTHSEAEGYNSEIEEINSLVQAGVSEILSTKNPTAGQAKTFWMRRKELISPEAFSAFVKVVRSFHAKTAQALAQAQE